MTEALKNLLRYIVRMNKKIKCKTVKGKVCKIVKGKVDCKSKKLKVCVKK